jgi:hypothetical protein
LTSPLNEPHHRRAMPTITRSLRPTCPACGFAVFNRRYPKCEKCKAELPASIVYTSTEIAGMREKERADDDERARRRAEARADRARRAAGAAFAGVVGDGIVSAPVGPTDIIDLSDLGSS